MTSPNAAITTSRGRTYKVPDPVTRELKDLVGVSTLKKQIWSYPLEQWKLKLVASAVAGSSALQGLALTDPRAAVKQIMARPSEAAGVGTAVHDIIDRLESGTLDRSFIAPSLLPFLEAYEACKKNFGFTVHATEQTIYNFQFSYAGSADQWLELPSSIVEQMGLSAEDGVLFPADIKTGSAVHEDVALQLRFYAGGEGIVIAPTKAELGFPEMEAELEDAIRSGNAKVYGEKTWSKAAIDRQYKNLESAWWIQYAQGCTFHSMPDGLRRDVGIVIHLHKVDSGDVDCKLVPVRLDGDTLDQGTAISVIMGLADLSSWSARRDIIMPALEAPSLASSSPLLAKIHAERAEAEAEDKRIAESTPEWNIHGFSTEAEWLASKFPGSDVVDADSVPASSAMLDAQIAWLKDVQKNHPELLRPLKAALDAKGITKSLFRDKWTFGELRSWRDVAAQVTENK